MRVRVASIARLSLLTFFVLVILNASQWLIKHKIGINPAVLIGVSFLYIAPLFLALATILYCSTLPRIKLTKNIKSFHQKIILLLTSLFLLSLYGFLRENLIANILTDLWIYFVVSCFLILGQYDRVWEDLERVLVILFWASFFMVVSGTGFLRQHLIDAGYTAIRVGGGPPVYTLAYELGPLMDCWPLVFAMGLTRKKNDIWKILSLGVIVAYLGMQIYFQKRAPAARAITYFLSAFIVLNIGGLTRGGQIAKARKFVGLSMISIVFLILLMPTEGIRNRYGQSDESRLLEAKQFIYGLSFEEWLIGRGFGGYFNLGPLSDHFVNVQVNDNGEWGRIRLHIGVLVPVLKGGLLFLFVHLLFVLPIIHLYRDRRWRQNRYNVVALIVLPVYTIFRFIEGGFSTGAFYDGIIFALCCSRISCNSKNV